MLRHTLRSLMHKDRMRQKAKEQFYKTHGKKFGQDQKFEFPAPNEDMRIGDAYAAFGFELKDRVTAKEIKKRFHALAKVHHPDSGGSPENFKRLKEAQKLLMQIKHDAPGVDVDGAAEGKAGGRRRGKTTFTRVNQADAMNTVDKTNRETNENQTTDVSDALAVFIVFPAVLIWYYYHNQRNVYRLSDSRSRMAVEEMRPGFEHPEAPQQEWHPWRASNGEKEHITALLEDRERRLGIRPGEAHPNYQKTVLSEMDQRREAAGRAPRLGENNFSSAASERLAAEAAAAVQQQEQTPTVTGAPRGNPFSPHKRAPEPAAQAAPAPAVASAAAAAAAR